VVPTEQVVVSHAEVKQAALTQPVEGSRRCVHR
jgi:hypothetical protein